MNCSLDAPIVQAEFSKWKLPMTFMFSLLPTIDVDGVLDEGNHMIRAYDDDRQPTWNIADSKHLCTAKRAVSSQATGATEHSRNPVGGCVCGLCHRARAAVCWHTL